MKRILLGMLALAAASACASTPSGPSQKILGIWNCAADSDGMSVAGKFTYLPDGLGRADATINVDAGGMKIQMTGLLDSTWTFNDDGTLTEGITDLKVQSATTGGQVMAPAMIATMIQPMVDQAIVGQTSTSKVEITDTTFISTSDDGVVTTCKR